MAKQSKMKTGTVRTNKNGSDSVFDICTIKEWGDMSDAERDAALLEAMWDSGVIDVFQNDE